MRGIASDQTTIIDFSRTISDIHSTIHSNTTSIREELDDHRVAIDQQTEDIESVFSALDEIEKKIEDVGEKFNARIDRLQMMLAQALMHNMIQVELSEDEQLVFSALEKSAALSSVVDVVMKTGLSADAVFVACEKMADKGIPLRKGSRDAVAFLFIEQTFLDAQKKNKTIKIDAAIEQKIGNHLLQAYFA